MALRPRTPDSLASPIDLQTKPLDADSPTAGPGWARWSSSLSDDASDDSLASVGSLKGGCHPEKLDPLYDLAQRGQSRTGAPVPPPRRGSLRATPALSQTFQTFRDDIGKTQTWRQTLPVDLELTEPLTYSDKHLILEETPLAMEDEAGTCAHLSTQGPPRRVTGAMKQSSLAYEEKRKSIISATKGKGKHFWLTFAAVFVCTFLTAVDLMIIAPILPTIAADMPSSSISAVWIASASLAASVSFQPFFEGLSDAIGRREALMFTVIVSLAGSVVACLARSMFILVIGRGIQGLGGGGMMIVGQIIVSDMTTPAEPSYFLGIISAAFAVAAVVAPLAGGRFATFDWRWAFYINFPIGTLALLMLWPARLPRIRLSLREKIQRVDLVGSIVLFGSIVALLIGLTNGGVRGSWTSASILGSMIIGGTGLLLFCVLEIKLSPLVRHPILSAKLFRHRTATIAYMLTFLHSAILFGATQALLLYFEIRQATPLQAAINALPFSVPLAPAALIASMIMAITGRYKGQIIAFEALVMLGTVSFIFLDLGTLTRDWALYQVVAAVGLGGLSPLTFPPIRATLPAEESAHAAAAFAFARSFGTVWGVAVVLIAFQVQAGQRLEKVPGAAYIGIGRGNVFEFVARLHTLPDSLREPLSEVYQKAIRVGFIILAPFALAGFVASMFIKHVPLHTKDRPMDTLGTQDGATLRSTSHGPMHDDEKEIGSALDDTSATDSFHMTPLGSQSSLSKSGAWSGFPADYDFKSTGGAGQDDLDVYRDRENSDSRATLKLPAAAHLEKKSGSMRKKTADVEERYALLRCELEQGNSPSTARVSCDSVDRKS